MNGLNQNQLKAFIQLLRKDLTRIEQLEGERVLKEELRQVMETTQIMIEE